MRLTGSEVYASLCAFDFMKCDKCGRICTKREMERGLRGPEGRVCPCGSMKYRPTNLPWWGWILPRVWAAAYVRLLGGILGYRKAQAQCSECGHPWMVHFHRAETAISRVCPRCEHLSEVQIASPISFADPGEASL